MKNLVVFSLCLLLLAAVGCKEAHKAEGINTKGPSDKMRTTIEFETINHDFGSITQEAPAKHRFTFRNTGKHDLRLTNVTASCGCTTPKWSKEPVAPGKSGFIDVQFDPKNKPGNFAKTITVTANTDPEQTKLSIQGEVSE